MRLPILASATLIALTGCYPFVSTDKYTEQLCELDEDGDSVNKCTRDESGNQITLDCNDSNAAIYPGNTEIPYDGLDNDCQDGDIVDVDEDDFPGISKADYEALGGEAWPLADDVALDCNDNDAAINPDASEIWYDGVDQNCDELCDYDEDQDGFADARQGQGNDCNLDATDCLDSDATAFPGAAGDVPYDGVDQDCDGANDFDPDGDGEIWSVYQTPYSEFLSRHGYPDGSPGFTDCYDDLDSSLPQGSPVDPATVNAAATELPGDGIDGDCSDLDGTVENDFDFDDDGFMEQGKRTEFLAYVERYINYERQDGTRPYQALFEAQFGATSTEWGDYYDAQDGDCDDTDPSRSPGALELLGDSVDQDCDGGVDTSPFGFGVYAWEGLGDVRVGATNSYFMMVAAASDSVTIGEDPALQSRLAAVSWDLTADNTVSPVDDTTFLSARDSDEVVYGGVALEPFSNGYYVAGSWFSGSSTRARLAVALEAGAVPPKHFDDGNQVDGFSVSGSQPHDEQDLRCDSATSTCWTVACGGGSVQVLNVSDSKNVAGFSSVGSGDATDAVIDCFIETQASAGTLLINTIESSGDVYSWEVSGTSRYFLDPASVSPFAAFSLSHASSHGDWLVLGKKSGGVTLYRSATVQRSVLGSRVTVAADAAFAGTAAYVAAVDASGNVVLAYGNPTASMTETVMPFHDANGDEIDARRVSIEAAGGRVLLAATGLDTDGNDVLGWVFLEI